MTDDRIVGTYLGSVGERAVSIGLSELPYWDEFPHPYDIEFEESRFGGVGNDVSSSSWNTNIHARRRQAKAKEFLKSWLTEQEYEALQDDNLIIPSKLFPDRTYKVNDSASQMVEVYTSGILDHKLCAVAKDPRFENDDTVLSKILMIKTNEKQFLKIAEKHPVNLDTGFGRLDTGFGRYLMSELSQQSLDSLTITWNIDGEISLNSESLVQPGQWVGIRGNQAVSDPLTGSARVKSRHNPN